MPCYCDPDKKELDEAKAQIRKRAVEIVDIIKRITHPTDRYTQELIYAMKLIEHLYTGDCDEKTK
jgi:hypothetical protein